MIMIVAVGAPCYLAAVVGATSHNSCWSHDSCCSHDDSEEDSVAMVAVGAMIMVAVGSMIAVTIIAVAME